MNTDQLQYTNKGKWLAFTQPQSRILGTALGVEAYKLYYRPHLQTASKEFFFRFV